MQMPARAPRFSWVRASTLRLVRLVPGLGRQGPALSPPALVRTHSRMSLAGGTIFVVAPLVAPEAPHKHAPHTDLGLRSPSHMLRTLLLREAPNPHAKSRLQVWHLFAALTRNLDRPSVRTWTTQTLNRTILQQSLNKLTRFTPTQRAEAAYAPLQHSRTALVLSALAPWPGRHPVASAPGTPRHTDVQGHLSRCWLLYLGSLPKYGAERVWHLVNHIYTSTQRFETCPQVWLAHRL